MAEGRMIKKRISESKKLGMLSTDSARLLYTWLIPWLDSEGRYLADPEILKGHIFPKVKNMTPKKIGKLLLELNRIGLIILYSQNGESYLQFSKFHDIQNIRKDREGESKLPAPTEDSVITPGVLPENSGLIKYNLREVNLREVKDLTPTEETILKELENVSGFPQDSAATISYLRKLFQEFPSVDPLEAIRGKIAWWIKKPLEKNSNPYLQIRNWFRIGAGFVEEASRERRIGQTKTKQKTDAEKEFDKAYEAKRKEIESHYDQQIEAAKKNKDQILLEGIENVIKEELAEWTEGYQGRT